MEKKVADQKQRIIKEGTVNPNPPTPRPNLPSQQPLTGIQGGEGRSILGAADTARDAPTKSEEGSMETSSNGTRTVEAGAGRAREGAGPEHNGRPTEKKAPSTGVLVERVKRTLRGVPPQRARAIVTLVLAELDEGAAGEDVPR